jgi:hypothetical protein
MELHAAIIDYARATERFLTAVAATADDLLDTHGEGGWSARRIVHHVADSEAQSYARLRRLLAEPAGSTIEGYDEAAWADAQVLGYRDLPIGPSVAVIRSVRAASLVVLARVGPDDLDRAGTHTESGSYTVRDWVLTYVAHPVEHADQLERAVRGLA